MGFKLDLHLLLLLGLNVFTAFLLGFLESEIKVFLDFCNVVFCYDKSLGDLLFSEETVEKRDQLDNDCFVNCVLLFLIFFLFGFLLLLSASFFYFLFSVVVSIISVFIIICFIDNSCKVLMAWHFCQGN